MATEQVCRCCLARGQELVSLREETVVGGVRLTFMKLLSQYTRGVTFQAWQPQNICMECVQHLENAHRFNETCLKSQEHHGTKSSGRPRRTKRDAVTTEKPKEVKILPKPTLPMRLIKLKCEFCHKQFMSEEFLKMHTAKHKSKMYCNECNIKFTNEYRLKQHAAEAHARKGHMCLLCLRLFKTIVALEKHRLQAHGVRPKSSDAENEEDTKRNKATDGEFEVERDNEAGEEENEAENGRVVIIMKDAAGKVVVTQEAAKLDGMNGTEVGSLQTGQRAKEASEIEADGSSYELRVKDEVLLDEVYFKEGSNSDADETEVKMEDFSDGEARGSEHVLVECDVALAQGHSDTEESHQGEVSRYEDVSCEGGEPEETVQYYVVRGDDETDLLEITAEQAELLVQGRPLEPEQQEAVEEVEPSVEGDGAAESSLEPGEIPAEDPLSAMSTHAAGVYTCRLCAVTTSRRFNMARHLATAHHVEALGCVWCGEKFDKVNAYIAHTRLRCSLDKQEYKPAKNVRRNMDCPICELTCTSARQLTVHMRDRHNGLKRLKECQLCRKTFTSRSGFSKHMDAHSGMRRQRCSMCPRVLSNGAALRSHVLGQHTRHRPHLCAECGRSFVSNDMLRKHLKLKHEGRRDFLCGECGRTFQQASHVAQHMWTHTGVKPHVCDYCGSRYTSSSGLKKHYYRAHNAEYTRDERRGDVRRRRLLRAGATMPAAAAGRPESPPDSPESAGDGGELELCVPLQLQAPGGAAETVTLVL